MSRRGRDHMVVGFITTYAIMHITTYVAEMYSIQHQVIKFVSELRQIGGFIDFHHVYISQSIRYARASSKYSDFLKRHLYLRNRLLEQGYIFRYQDLVEIYSVSADDGERWIFIQCIQIRIQYTWFKRGVKCQRYFL